MVYTSDRVGEHDFSLLRRLVLPDGFGERSPGQVFASRLMKSESGSWRRLDHVLKGNFAWPLLPCPAVPRCRLPGRPTADCLFRDVSRDGSTVLKASSVLVLAASLLLDRPFVTLKRTCAGTMLDGCCCFSPPADLEPQQRDRGAGPLQRAGQCCCELLLLPWGLNLPSYVTLKHLLHVPRMTYRIVPG